MIAPRTSDAEVRVHGPDDLDACVARLAAYGRRRGTLPLSRHPGWLAVLRDGLGHTPFALEATEAGETRGYLPLSYMRSALFGRFLVSLPYLNYGGVLADDDGVARSLIDRAVELAGRLDARHLELRHERPIEHPALGHRLTTKVHMRLPLPGTVVALWDGLAPKVRNLVRKGQKAGLTIDWGGEPLLPEFHDVLSRNMRDLGTPVFGRALFRCALRRFPGDAELCVARLGGRPIAAALLLHGEGTTEVPTAGSLREFNGTSANMLMYWNLLERSVRRGQSAFDFGRSTVDGNTYRFKKQWGALPGAAEWQFHVRRGSASDVRPEGGRYRHCIRAWRRLPVWLTRLIGPSIVRGIP